MAKAKSNQSKSTKSKPAPSKPTPRKATSGQSAEAAPPLRHEVIVTVDERQLRDMTRVTRGLEKAGMQVQEVLEFTGQVVGLWSGENLRPLQQVDGVIEASSSRAISLPPPDSDLQ